MIETPIDYQKMATLFDADIPNRPMLFAILLGHNPGRAVVDDAAHPSQCMIRTNDALVFVSRQVEHEFLEQALTYFRRGGHVGLIWHPGVQALDPGKADRIVPRVAFSECSAQGSDHARIEANLPGGFELCPLDLELLQRCEWKPAIQTACGSLENFLAQGFGVCLLNGDEIISEAYAPFWGEAEVEIGVVTHAAHQGRGYAALTCAHLVQECRRRGAEPYWSCEIDNLASAKLARKLGFTGERRYELRLYRAAS
jgi:GNAT superfamily N-acetyltransferase